MIPVKLTLQGLYSYQQKQTIDFTNLIKAGIFGIFGSVGSGKSTILEAITFALYGKTDRLNISGDNRNYNMMNLKSNEMNIEFQFHSGKEDDLYMVTVKGRRNSKQFEDVKALERNAYIYKNNDWLPISLDSLEDIIGLSYDNFKRTIIIPQGKFQEFLQLSDKERTQMMKELFNLDKYEFFYKVVALESANEKEKQFCTGNLQQLGDVTEDQIAQTQLQIINLNTEIKEYTLALEILQKDISAHQQLKELVNQIEQLDIIIKNLNDSEFKMIDKENIIRNYEYCLLNFKNLLDTYALISNRIKILEENNKLSETKKQSLFSTFTDLNVKFENIRTDYENKDQLKQQADELDKIIKINLLNSEIVKLQDRISKGEDTMKTLDDDLKITYAKQLELTSSLKLLRAQLPDFNILSTIKNWHTVNNLLVIEHEKITSDLKSAENDHKILLTEKNTLCTGNYFTLNNIDADTSMNWMQERLQILKQRNEDLDIEMRHYHLQIKLNEYASSLVNGRPCPLCGSTEHPAISSFTEMAATLDKAKKLKNDIENEIKEIDIQQKKLVALNTSIQFRDEVLQKVTFNLQSHTHKVDEHKKLFSWEGFQQEGAILKAFDEAEKLRNTILKQEQNLETITKHLQEVTDNKEKYGGAIEKLKHEKTAMLSELQTLVSQLVIFTKDSFAGMPSSEIQNNKTSILNKLQIIERDFLEVQGKIKLIQAEYDVLSGKLEANIHALDQERASLIICNDNILNQLINSEYKNIEEVQGILLTSIDLEKAKTEIKDYRQKLAVATEQKYTLVNILGDRTYNPTIHVNLINSFKQKTSDLNIKLQELGSTDNELQKLLSNIESRKKLLKKVEALESRAENIKVLKQLFKASGFVNYISSVYLHELCFAANERFSRLTRQKLSLEITDDNNFQVRDFMNGGKVRSVKTLSGGQTFQAALSLALALADNIQKITVSNQNFFFLDEGFGSLDKESLEIVFDTLKTLRKENRIVGIISHVEEMQQEIDNHLKIINDEEQGSLVFSQY